MARIAIVDDSRLARTLASRALGAAGHAVQEVEPSSLFDVLKELRREPPDLLMMDFLMPDCPGISLVRACKDDPALQRMRILVLTAHVDKESDHVMKRLGVDGILRKPTAPADLQAAVATTLSGT